MDEEKIVEKLITGMKRKAGTWGLPKDDRDVLKITKIISLMARGDYHDLKGYPQVPLYGVLGDDKLFDELDSETVTYLKNCAKVTKSFIKKFVKEHDEEDVRDPEQYHKMEELAGML